MNKYQMRAKSSRKAEVLIYQDIGDGWVGGISAKRFADDLAKLGAMDEINIRVNSNGGSVFDGVAIFNTLKKNPARIVVDVDGIAASIASIICMAGDEIRMAANSFLMIHNPWIVASGTAGELRNIAARMDKVRETMLDTYANRPKTTRSKVSEWMNAETWFTADEALAAGLIDGVSQELKMAALSWFDLSRYRNPPKQLLKAQSKRTAKAIPIAKPHKPAPFSLWRLRIEDNHAKLLAMGIATRRS